MAEESKVDVKKRKIFSKKVLFIAVMIVAILLAITCFILISVLPKCEGSVVKNPLRGFIAGVGLFGVATPLCMIGALIRKKSENSPYFEEGFIAGVLSLFGYVCVMVGLVCIGLGIYGWVETLMESK